jgi:hypothetical protein
VVCAVSEDQTFICLGEREGFFVPERSLVHVELMGVGTRPGNVLVYGEETDWSYEEADGKLVVPMAEDAAEVVVEVRA